MWIAVGRIWERRAKAKTTLLEQIEARNKEKCRRWGQRSGRTCIMCLVDHCKDWHLHGIKNLECLHCPEMNSKNIRVMHRWMRGWVLSNALLGDVIVVRTSWSGSHKPRCCGSVTQCSLLIRSRDKQHTESDHRLSSINKGVHSKMMKEGIINHKPAA